jgi:hypothetical protein
MEIGVGKADFSDGRKWSYIRVFTVWKQSAP